MEFILVCCRYSNSNHKNSANGNVPHGVTRPPLFPTKRNTTPNGSLNSTGFLLTSTPLVCAVQCSCDQLQAGGGANWHAISRSVRRPSVNLHANRGGHQRQQQYHHQPPQQMCANLKTPNGIPSMMTIGMPRPDRALLHRPIRRVSFIDPPPLNYKNRQRLP